MTDQERIQSLEARIKYLEDKFREFLKTLTKSNTGNFMIAEVEPDKINPPWTREVFDRIATTCGVSQKEAEACWSYYDTEGWKLKSGNRIQGDPRSLLIRWSSNPQRLQGNGNGHATRQLSAFDIKDRLAAIQSELAKPCKEADIPRFRELNAEKERLIKARTGISA